MRKAIDIFVLGLVCLAALVLVAAPSHSLRHSVAGVVHHFAQHASGTEIGHSHSPRHGDIRGSLHGADGDTVGPAGTSHVRSSDCRRHTCQSDSFHSFDGHSPDDGHSHPCCGTPTPLTLARTAGGLVPGWGAVGPLLPQTLWVVADATSAPKWGLRASPPGMPGYQAALRAVVMLT